MGTRGAIVFVIDGIEKVGYNHWDSYPSGLGVHVLEWMREQANLFLDDELRQQVRALQLVDEDEEPTEEERERFSKYWNKSVSTGQDWYSLLRETQGKPGEILAAGAMTDGGNFPLDSLFCEWAYVIDLDTEVFEVYKGFQKSPPTEGRWVDRGKADGQGYWPVQRVVSWKFGELPDNDDFIKATGETD